MKRLIYLHQYFKFPEESGGTRSYDLATSFQRYGYEVEVISATSNIRYKNNRGWTLVERDGIKVHYVYLPYGNHLSYFKRILVFLRFIWLTSFKLKKIKCDVVLATSTPLTIGIPALFKKKICKTPFIFEVRDVWPEAVIAIGAIKNKLLQKLLFILEKKIYFNATQIVPLSTDMQKSIITRYPQIAEKTKMVIENISEISRFQNCDELVDIEQIVGFKPRFSVLYAGTFGRVNGLHQVVELAEKTINIDPKLVYFLVGSGGEKKKVMAKAERCKVLNKNLFILEPISKNELPKWYRSVSMGASFVIDIKELWANSANKFFDTLAASKPALINYGGWQSEVLKSCNAGYVLPPLFSDEDVKDFVNYTCDKILIQEQEENALKLAKERYSLDIAVEKYLKVFNEMKS